MIDIKIVVCRASLSHLLVQIFQNNVEAKSKPVSSVRYIQLETGNSYSTASLRIKNVISANFLWIKAASYCIKYW